MVASTHNYQVRRTPTFLKHLVENRARADGQVQRLRSALVDLEAELARVLAHRDACDSLIVNFTKFDPAEIVAIRGWLGRRGGRGKLVAAIREVIRLAGPTGIGTCELMDQLLVIFELNLTLAQRQKWRTNSLRGRLHELKVRGEIEPICEGRPPGNAQQRWRIPQRAVGSLEALAKSARTLGVQVEVANDETLHDPYEHG